MKSYQVIRPFAGYEPGQVLTGGVMINDHRAAQLISQRYITPLSEGGMQPTVATLLGSTVRQLDDLAGRVEDACLLRAAMANDERESALRIYERRLAELEPDGDEDKTEDTENE